MKIIKVLNEKEFEDLKIIISDNDMESIKITSDSIETSDTKYVKASTAILSAKDSRDDSTFKRFESFYTGEVSSDTWDTLKTMSIDKFFSRRNFLVYNPIYQSLTKKEYEDIILSYFKVYAPNVDVSALVIDEKEENNVSKIYEVAVKFPFRFSGEAVYTINKFYFDDSLNLLSPSASLEMFNLIESISKTNKEEAEDIDNFKITQEEINSFNDSIFEKMENGFSDYLVGEAKKVFDEYTNKSIVNSDSELLIECGSPRFRYVASLNVFNKKFIIKNSITGDELFECSINSSNHVNFKCLQCGDDNICSNNMINIYSNISGEIIKTPVEIDLNLQKLPFSYRLNDLSYHCLKAFSSCKNCVKIICSNHITKCVSCDNYICSDCTNFDYVIKDYSSSKMFHKSCATFNRDTLKFIPKTEVKICACCGNSYSDSNYYNDKYCSLCGPIVNFDSLNNEEKQKYYELYDIHKRIFPMSSRSNSNICNENFNNILFRIKNQYLLIDKNECNLLTDEIKLKKIKIK